MNIPLKIKIALWKAGMSSDDLAKALNVHPVSVSRWLRGHRNPSLQNLKRIEDVTGVRLMSLDWVDQIPEPQEQSHEQSCREP